MVDWTIETQTVTLSVESRPLKGERTKALWQERGPRKDEWTRKKDSVTVTGKIETGEELQRKRVLCSDRENDKLYKERPVRVSKSTVDTDGQGRVGVGTVTVSRLGGTARVWDPRYV